MPLPTDHPLWRGPLPAFAAEIGPLLEGHDVVLAIGMPVFRLFGPGPGEPLPPEAALVHLDDDAREVGKVHEPAVALVGDPALGLAGLLARLGPPPPEALARRAREAAAAADARRRARARVARAAGGERVTPAAFAQAVAAAAGPRDLVVDEALTSTRAAAVGDLAPHRGDLAGPPRQRPRVGAAGGRRAPSWPTPAGA